MKKIFIFIFCMLLVMSLCACTSSAQTTYTARRDGIEYLVDRESQTISDGTHTYRYSLDGDSDGYSIRITYPDGSTYWWNKQNSGFGVGYGGWSDDYDENRYVNGDILCDILEDEVPEERDPKPILLIVVLLAIGIFNTVSPHTAWYLENGWRFKNAEPSDLALGMTRFSGIIFIAVAVITMFV